MKNILLAILCAFGMNAAADGGILTLRPDQILVYPDGSTLDVSSTTNTAGVQELIDEAVSGGYDMHITGGEESSTGGGIVYNINQSVVFPAMQGKRITSGAVTLNINSNVGANPGIVFDSTMLVDVDINGQVVYWGTGDAILFRPVNPVPVDNMVTIVDSRFRILATVQLGNTTNNAAVNLVGDQGAITNNVFDFHEINDGDWGIIVATPNHEVARNRFYSAHVHNQSNTSVKVGHVHNHANNAKITGNKWDVVCEPDSGKRGFDTYARNESMHLIVHPTFGALQYALILESTAINNRIYSSELGGTILNNGGSSNLFY